MEMLKRLFGRGGDATPAVPDAEDELFERRHDNYRWFNAVCEKPEGYYEPFPFLRLRDDLRRHVLEFVLEASWSGIQKEKPERDWNFETKAYDEPKHLPFSTLASLRTLTHHTRTIKAVCTAVCSDVRLLEKTVARPSAWLAGLWHVELGIKSPRTELLRRCHTRAAVVGRANFASEMYSRLETHGEPRDTVFKCPATWSKQRAEGAEHLFDVEEGPLAWAHARTRTSEQEHGLTPIDPQFMASICSKSFVGFVDHFARSTWTLKVSSVRIVYRGDYIANEDGSRSRTRGNADDTEALESSLAAFFGAEQMSRAPWIQEWCNCGTDAFDPSNADTMSYLVRCKRHDPTRPPVTRLRDLRDREGRPALGIQDLELVRGHPSLSAATIDVSFYHDATPSEQVFDEDDEDAALKPPCYQFIGPVSRAKCRFGSASRYDDTTFKISTQDFSERNKSLETAVFIIPMVPNVFDAICTCSIVGMS